MQPFLLQNTIFSMLFFFLLPYIEWILWWLLLVNGITNPWCTFWIVQHQYWSITMFSYLFLYGKKMLLAGLLVLSFDKFCFWEISPLCIKVAFVLLLFLKLHMLVYPKQFLLFPKFFCMSWDSKRSYGKIGFGPFFRPY